MCRFFRWKKRQKKTIIPIIVSNDERLVRFILSPLHFKNGKLRSNAFNPSVNSDEISVTRLDYSSAEECKILAHKMDSIDSTPPKHYSGFCLLNKAIAIRCGSKDVIWSPKVDNHAHSDIIMPAPRADKNTPIPAEIQEVIDNLRDQSRYFEDPQPEAQEWKGEPLTI